MTTTTPTIRDAIAVEVRLLLAVLVIPFAFDLALIYLAWRHAGTLAGWHPPAFAAAWARPAARLADRIDVYPRGARP